MANQIQGVVLDPPGNVVAEKQGMVSLVNLAEQELIYQHTGMLRPEGISANVQI